MESEKYTAEVAGSSRDDNWRRRCGCLKTSEKLKKILETFPSAPPPTPIEEVSYIPLKHTCISAYCSQVHHPPFSQIQESPRPRLKSLESDTKLKQDTCKTVRVLRELVQLLQFSVTTTAVAIYYLIYCYMQLIYYTLWSAIYFHNADGPMKLTIALIAITSIVIFINLIYKLEKFIGTGLME
ncbi:uncharacterized protein LOC125057403 isoform X2 [Pieris napi]|nr:uncharacterized protein LOC125057403 isoform X2 [Pieris napi]XP_047517033.1 uncharacterized protein LOC125057403 isoform X2 [Pieris napi]